MHCRQELQQKSWKTARLFLQDRDQMKRCVRKLSKLQKVNVQDQYQDFMIQDQDFHFCPTPRDQDPGLEDYINA